MANAADPIASTTTCPGSPPGTAPASLIGEIK
jgi:hypothetical protein